MNQMPWWLTALIGLVGAIATTWLALVITLVITRPRGPVLGEAVRLLPDVIRLLRRLATDRSIPRSARVGLWLLLAYLASPIDIIPDFIPLLGYADDAIITAVVLRSVMRRVGRDAVRERWSGTAEGFDALTRLAGLAG